MSLRHIKRIGITALLLVFVTTTLSGQNGLSILIDEPPAPETSIDSALSTATFSDSVATNKRRLRMIVGAEAGLYAVSMAGLYSMWYKDYPQSTFHFFNDNNEWMQMDKVGHFVTSYYISRLTAYSVRWAGMSQKNSVWYGGAAGFAYMTTIEILDGFSAGWGASTGDLVANTSGALLFVGQEMLWHDQRIILKYSWHPTEYPDYRPDLLGRNWPQQFIKDYNGITLWASANLSSFGVGKSWIPKWLNVAVGYGAEGMTGAVTNSTSYHNKPIASTERVRQIYLTFDIDLTRIHVKSKWLKLVFNAIGFLKIPAPALEYNTEGSLIFHPLYF